MKDTQVHQVPQWLNDGFLQKVFQGFIRDPSLKIVSSSFVVASKSNDSFASPIVRANVKISSNLEGTVDYSFVLKIPSPQRMVNEDDSFGNEIRFYNSTLEEMHRLLKHSGESVELGPRVIYYSSSTNAVIVLEDLAALNYQQPSDMLELNPTISAVYKLAKWHAVSIFMAKENQDLQYSTGLFNKKYSEQLAFMYENFVYFINDIASWDEYSLYAKKFAALKNEFFVRGQKIFSAKPGGFNVLNHGDLNLKNLMIREDDKGINVKFVDYQFCVWATPAIDLFYLLHLVVTPEVRVLRKTELIQFYYKELVGALKKLGYLSPPPTLLELQLELLQNGFLEVIITTCLLPFYSSGYSQREISLEQVSTLRERAYSNEQYQSVVKAQLPYFLNKGFLN